jgi:hypothetical protein
MAGPFIDTSVMLLDPQFTDRFSVVQRVQQINNFGEVSTVNTTSRDILGVVTPARPGDLRRVPEMQRGTRTIVIFTRARLNSAAQGCPPGTQRQPDLLVWHGDNFMVIEVLPWTSFGPGWVRVIATSVDRIDAVT